MGPLKTLSIDTDVKGGVPEDIGDSLLLWASDSKGEDGKDKRFVIIFGMKLIRVMT